MLPLTGTFPIPWSTETFVAFVAFQVSVVDWPTVMLAKLSETAIVGCMAGVLAATPPQPEIKASKQVKVTALIASLTGETSAASRLLQETTNPGFMA